MSIDMSQFYQVFFEESAEHLAEMERLLLEMDVDAPDIEEMNAIFRAAHSIKGGSGTFGFTDMTEVTHVLENLLDQLRKGEMAPRSEMIDVFLEAADVLKEQLNCHTNGTDADPAPAETVCEKLRALAGQDQQQEAHAPAAHAPAVTSPEESAADTVAESLPSAALTLDITFRPGKAFLKRESAIDELTDELSRQGTLEIVAQPSSTGTEKKSKKDKDKKGKKAKTRSTPPEWQFRLTTESSLEAIQDIFAFVAEPEEVVILPQMVAEQSASPSVEDDPGYGFFDTSALDEVEVAEDGSYGFFTTQAPTEEDPGYGFFTELPVLQESLGEEGDGFGFFAPLPPIPQEEAPKPVAEAPRPKTAEPAKPKERTASSGAGGDTSIRVSVERVDQLINLVGELVITQAMLAQTVAGVDPVVYESLQNGLAQLERNTRDLQESVMSIRMMPISFVFSRFPRVVRDLASKLNKQVELVTVGENTELDKGLIEKIADPLTHLVRNSLDHGIESPDKRIAAGKPAKGTITLSASHQGGNIVIEVSDDGAGLNRDKILSKAMERGLDASESMPDNDVWMLIFEPGFSTADVVTDVSGRGVGMDVVKRNITEMGGVVTIGSAPGIGTTMTIRLPLTLAILDGMSVSLGGNVYVIPLNMIVETLQPRPEDIKTVTGQGHMVHVRGEYLPIIALHSVFNMPTDITNPCDGVLVLIEAEGKKAALFVDALVGQQQVVIKSLETNFRKIVGVSGATIMGDGTVALILDVATLIKMGQ